jgi:hypothetical protein
MHQISMSRKLAILRGLTLASIAFPEVLPEKTNRRRMDDRRLLDALPLFKQGIPTKPPGWASYQPRRRWLGPVIATSTASGPEASHNVVSRMSVQECPHTTARGQRCALLLRSLLTPGQHFGIRDGIFASLGFSFATRATPSPTTRSTKEISQGRSARSQHGQSSCPRRRISISRPRIARPRRGSCPMLSCARLRRSWGHRAGCRAQRTRPPCAAAVQALLAG